MAIVGGQWEIFSLVLVVNGRRKTQESVISERRKMFSICADVRKNISSGAKRMHGCSVEGKEGIGTQCGEGDIDAVWEERGNLELSDGEGGFGTL